MNFDEHRPHLILNSSKFPTQKERDFDYTSINIYGDGNGSLNQMQLIVGIFSHLFGRYHGQYMADITGST